MKKRILSALLTLGMVLTMLPFRLRDGAGRWLWDDQLWR